MAKASEVDQFKNSNLVFKKTSGQTVSIQGRFTFKSAKYELTGELDLATGRPQSIHHRLTWGDSPVYDLSTSFGRRTSRAQFRFGKATKGVRTLTLNAERLTRGALVTGFADGRELVPYIASGCACRCGGSKRKPPRPVLAWTETATAQPLSLSLPSNMGPELEGLATVMERSIDERGGDGGGGILTDIEWIICYLTCIVELLWCVITNVGDPNADKYNIICGIIFTECETVCLLPTL